MAHDQSNLLTDSGSRIIPCYYNPSTGLYEPIEGKNGSTNIRLVDGQDIALGNTADPVADVDQLSEPHSAISLFKAGCKILEDKIAAQQNPEP